MDYPYPEEISLREVLSAGLRRIFAITPPSSPPQALSLPELLDRFESLGDNCEFGAVQREAGVDSLNLFKWYSTSIDVLVDLLDDDLAGVDDPAQIRLAPEGDQGSGRVSEMILHHARLRGHAHTFTSTDYITEEALRARELRRLVLMRRKFLEDLQEGRRIYVFRSLNPVPETEVLRLLAALQRHGPNQLLFVRLADATLKAGEARLAAPGLVIGALDELACYHDGMSVRTELWPTLVRRVHALLESNRLSVVPPPRRSRKAA